MEYLEGPRARSAVMRALGRHFIVPATGERVALNCVEFALLRRGEVLDDALRYRVRLADDGVLLGGFVGEEVSP